MTQLYPLSRANTIAMSRSFLAIAAGVALITLTQTQPAVAELNQPQADTGVVYTASNSSNGNAYKRASDGTAGAVTAMAGGNQVDQRANHQSNSVCSE